MSTQYLLSSTVAIATRDKVALVVHLHNGNSNELVDTSNQFPYDLSDDTSERAYMGWYTEENGFSVTLVGYGVIHTLPAMYLDMAAAIQPGQNLETNLNRLKNVCQLYVDKSNGRERHDNNHEAYAVTSDSGRMTGKTYAKLAQLKINALFGLWFHSNLHDTMKSQSCGGFIQALTDYVTDPNRKTYPAKELRSIVGTYGTDWWQYETGL